MQNKKQQSLEITEEEKQALYNYSRNEHLVWNTIMEMGIDTELNHGSVVNGLKSYSVRSIKEVLDVIPKMYGAMCKNRMNRGEINTLYRGTSVEEVERWQQEGEVGKCISTTIDRDIAAGSFSLNRERPACVNIQTKDVPWVSMRSLFSDNYIKDEKEVLLSPFLKVTEVDEQPYTIAMKVTGKTTQRNYNVKLEQQELTLLSNNQEKQLETEIFEQAETQIANISTVIKLKSELAMLRERKEGIENYIEELKYSKKNSKELENMMEVLENTSKEILKHEQQQEELSQQVTEWKSKIRTLCMSKCKRRELEIEKEEEQARKKEETDTMVTKTSKEVYDSLNVMIKMVKNNTSFFESLISRQQQMDIIAKECGFTYNRQIQDPEQLINIQKTLSEYLSRLGQKTDNTFDRELNENNISEMLSYNGSSIAMFYDSLCREYIHLSSDSMAIFREEQKNEFKKGIADKLSLICAEADLQRLSQELQSINGRGKLKMLFDRITGKEAVYQARQECIKTTIQAIRIKKSQIEQGIKNPADKEYSIDEIFADIQLFKYQNMGNPEMQKYIAEVLTLEAGIQKTFTINPIVVDDIMEKKQAMLPEVLETKKQTRQERINAVYRENEAFLVNNDYIGDETQKKSGMRHLRIRHNMLQMHDFSQNAQMIMDRINGFVEGKKPDEIVRSYNSRLMQ